MKLSDKAITWICLAAAALVIGGWSLYYSTVKQDCDERNGTVVRGAGWSYECVEAR